MFTGHGLRCGLVCCIAGLAGYQPFPSHPLSWRMGITRGPDGAALVHLRWEPGQWQPTIATIPLKTTARPEGVWVTSDECLYATWEVGPGIRDVHQIRVYQSDGTWVGEYKSSQENKYVSPPLIIEEDKTVCFVTGSGIVMLGRPAGDPPHYVFQSLPQSLPVSLKIAPIRLVERQTGRERILDGLGCVTSVGSWWAD